jgi:hypothetical protein
MTEEERAAMFSGLAAEKARETERDERIARIRARKGTAA